MISHSSCMNYHDKIIFYLLDCLPVGYLKMMVNNNRHHPYMYLRLCEESEVNSSNSQQSLEDMSLQRILSRWRHHDQI